MSTLKPGAWAAFVAGAIMASLIGSKLVKDIEPITDPCDQVVTLGNGMRLRIRVETLP